VKTIASMAFLCAVSCLFLSCAGTKDLLVDPYFQKNKLKVPRAGIICSSINTEDADNFLKIYFYDRKPDSTLQNYDAFFRNSLAEAFHRTFPSIQWRFIPGDSCVNRENIDVPDYASVANRMSYDKLKGKSQDSYLEMETPPKFSGYSNRICACEHTDLIVLISRPVISMKDLDNPLTAPLPVFTFNVFVTDSIGGKVLLNSRVTTAMGGYPDLYKTSYYLSYNFFKISIASGSEIVARQLRKILKP
jgi:hypothetical protein